MTGSTGMDGGSGVTDLILSEALAPVSLLIMSGDRPGRDGYE
ncbi:hypothetical protein [Gluconobacter sphaericus]|nr:hypothetical protein [Gluconobacter sphaericus]